MPGNQIEQWVNIHLHGGLEGGGSRFDVFVNIYILFLLYVNCNFYSSYYFLFSE